MTAIEPHEQPVGFRDMPVPTISPQERWERDQAEALRLAPTLDPRWQAARQQYRQSEQRATFDELHAAIAPALREAVQTAQQLHQKRTASLEQARQELATHKASQPADDSRESVLAYSDHTVRLTGAVTEYERFAAQSHAQLSQAQAAAKQAVDTQRLGEMRTIGTEIGQDQIELQAALAEKDKEKQALIDAHNERCKPKAARYHLLEHLYNW